MPRPLPELDSATDLRKSFEQLLEALDNGGFTVAAAHTDLARHAYEQALIGHRNVMADDNDGVVPASIGKVRCG